MNLIYKLGKTAQSNIKKREAKDTYPKLNTLIIEDDYVSYLYLNEVLTDLKFNVFHAISFEEVFKEPLNSKRFDLLILNLTLTSTTDVSVIKYLREYFSIPIVVVDDQGKKNLKHHKIIDESDGVISLNADTACFAETISDVLEKPFSQIGYCKGL